jgi:hypothetical protein
MNTKHSTNFWLVYALWVFATLFMSFVELISILEVKSENIIYLKYIFLIGSFSGALLVIFNSLFLFKEKPYFKKLALLSLLGYLTAQITMLLYCFYKEIPNLVTAATIRIIFILFQLVISFYILRSNKRIDIVVE